MLSSLTGTPSLFVDIITTGGAVRDTTRALRQAGATVHTVICTIDRGPNPGEALTDVDLTTRHLLTEPSSTDGAPEMEWSLVK